MRTQITNERLLEIIKEEISKAGQYVFTDKRRTAEEMLMMRGIKL